MVQSDKFFFGFGKFVHFNGAFDSHDLFTLLSSQMEMAVGDSVSASGSPGSCPCFSFPHMIYF